ncbi:centrosomal protein 43 [Mixophyes fleayi]|uniref:centrosomal protein 43 n=1 Tax=Mixophyes fleayi TaxID=3061075 RepID=UPI003F4E4284
MSAAEEDTELRDLLIHTLENNGVLNKIKAELRASVFLALDEQERADNKSSLINESLRQFLGTRDGRLVVGLVTDFLQHFHLDFTLAVLQPEAGLPNTPDDRAVTARELGLSEAGRKGPLILELLRHYQQKESAVHGDERPRSLLQELSPGHTAEAQAKFELYARDKNGELGKEELLALLADLFPHIQKNTLDRYVTELTVADNDSRNDGIGLQEFLGMYIRLSNQCRSVSAQDCSDLIHSQHRQLDGHSRTESHSDRIGSSSTNLTDNQNADIELKLSDVPSAHVEIEDPKLDEDDIEGDSFFDDPIPKPDKTYGWKKETSKPNGSLSVHTSLLALKSEQSSLSGAPKFNDLDRDAQHNTLKYLKTTYDKMASLEIGAGNEDDYIDDFNSTSQRSDKSEVSIGEDLEEDLSVDDLTGSDNKLEDLTLDNSISHISDVADYLEDVS